MKEFGQDSDRREKCERKSTREHESEREKAYAIRVHGGREERNMKVKKNTNACMGSERKKLRKKNI